MRNAQGGEIRRQNSQASEAHTAPHQFGEETLGRVRAAPQSKVVTAALALLRGQRTRRKHIFDKGLRCSLRVKPVPGAHRRAGQRQAAASAVPGGIRRENANGPIKLEVINDD